MKRYRRDNQAVGAMWLAVLLLMLIACGSAQQYPAQCQYQVPRVECRGHAPTIKQLDELPADFTELTIRDVDNDNELAGFQLANSSFVRRLQALDVVNVRDMCDMRKLTWNLEATLNVRRLNVSRNGLTLTAESYFKDYIPKFYKLEELNMEQNNIEELIELSTFGCDNLTTLYLTDNKISIIRPNAFVGLKLLTFLKLSNNRLVTLNRVFEPLVSLESLYLANNRLEYVGVNWFRNLTELVTLDLTGNKFTFILPDVLKPLKNIKILMINDSLTPKQDIRTFFNLLSEERQSKIIHTLIRKLPKDSTTINSSITAKTNNYKCSQYCQCHSPKIECHGFYPVLILNQISGSFTELIINNLSGDIEQSGRFMSGHTTYFNRLQSIEITNVLTLQSENFLRSWNAKKSNETVLFPNLQSLNFSHNKISKIPSFQFVFNASKIRVMDLGHNVIRTMNDWEFELPKLKWLDLADNEINDISYRFFENCKFLEYLDLSNNKLRWLDRILNPLNSLQRLLLAGNQLTFTEYSWFRNLTQLVELDISRNKLIHVQEDSLRSLSSLSVLKLSENPLRIRHRSLFLGIGRLEILDASRIGLVRVPDTLTHSIGILKLAGNQLTSINSGDLDDYMLLRELDLSDNRLVGIEEDALGRLDDLVELNLSGNILSTIPKRLSNGLQILDLSQNALSSLKLNDLENLHSLRELNLSGNVITEIEAGFFRQLTKLKVLDVSDNPLFKLPSDTLNGPSKLSILCISGLSSLKTDKNQNQDTAFPFLTPENLVKLDISRSPVLAAQLLADNAALSACKNLQELDLSYTSITTVRSDLGYVLPQLQRLNLIGNDWNCTGDQLWLGEWISQHRSSYEFSPRCKTPSKFEGKLLQDVYDSDRITKDNQTFVGTLFFSGDSSKIHNSLFITPELLKAAINSTSNVNDITTRQPLKIEKSQEKNKTEVNTTHNPTSVKRNSQNSSNTSDKKEFTTISTSTYTKESAIDIKKLVPTEPSEKTTTRMDVVKESRNKRLGTTESIITSSTISRKLNKNTYSTTPIAEDVKTTTTTTTKTAPSITPPRISTHTDTTTVISSTTEKVPSTKLKQSTTTTTTMTATTTTTTTMTTTKTKTTPSSSIKLEESTTSGSKAIKEDVPAALEDKSRKPNQKLQQRVLSEFAHSKLLLSGKETPAVNNDDNEQSKSFAEELNGQSGARTSETLLASGAHPGMLVLLGASMVAAATLTVVLSRRAVVNRRDRLYQRHENIEVHALTPTTELW